MSDNNSIQIKGARVHNLKNVDVTIPRNQLVVVTGVSGSGKSSLTIDTLFAEGQRRYVESLSSYARQFMGRMNKPDVDLIEGISPAIAIEQKVSSRSSRSTVGTLTEIYDYLRMLFARVGRTYSPLSGEEVKKHDVSDVVDYIKKQKEETRLYILAPLGIAKLKDQKSKERNNFLQLQIQKGFTRLRLKGETHKIEALLELDPKELAKLKLEDAVLLIDRLQIKKNDEELLKRAADSIGIAFFEGEGNCCIEIEGKKHPQCFNNRFELDGMRFEEPSPTFFNFNNSYGACGTCEGFGSVLGIDPDLVIPNKTLSVFEDAIVPWKGPKMGKWKRKLTSKAEIENFPIHRPVKDLDPKDFEKLWAGTKNFDGLHAFFDYLKEKSYKIQYRVMLSRYRGRTTCPDCLGTRLRKDSAFVKVDGHSLSDFVLMPIDKLAQVFKKLKLNKHDQAIAKRLLEEVQMRLQFMEDVGLGYLNLNRMSNTLSGGETQRINLTRTLGSNLTSSLYILDEPSIGLHPRDTHRLVKVLKGLRDLGNTVVVVEHEEDIIRASDYLIDMGPEAGIHGGEVVFQGAFKNALSSGKTLTADYLTQKREIPVPKKRRKPNKLIKVLGAREHNLKNFDAHFPLGCLSVVTGVSGSGKTTLVKKILAPAIQRELEGYGSRPGECDGLAGNLDAIAQVTMIDQNPIGKSSRSNPVTYIKAYDAIRELFAQQKAAQARALKPKHFSFNVDGGRCDECKGEGEIVVEMQFLADVRLVCDECQGQRFQEEVLAIQYRGKNIHDVLQLSIEEAIDFFSEKPEIQSKLQPLLDVGLSYVKLGQSSNTLSGGEAQRVKLASFLGKGRSEKSILFLFDEPTTGLHFHDIQKLLNSLQALVNQGHTVVIIEHNMEVIKCADWVIDLGPEGGAEGGTLVYQGKPEGLAKVKESYTGQFLQEKLA